MRPPRKGDNKPWDMRGSRQRSPVMKISSHPKADFAFNFGMITEEEYEACKIGAARVVDDEIVDFSRSLSRSPSSKIYAGRADEIRVNRLLGLNDDGTPKD